MLRVCSRPGRAVREHPAPFAGWWTTLRRVRSDGPSEASLDSWIGCGRRIPPTSGTTSGTTSRTKNRIDRRRHPVAAIDAVGAREILDSRGNPTVEVEVLLEDGTVSRAAVPSGASTGAFEAYELRDGDKNRYLGKGVTKAVDGHPRRARPRHRGHRRDASSASSTRPSSRSTAPRTSSASAPTPSSASASRLRRPRPTRADLPLFRYLGGPNAHILPVPLLNVINGGSHADTGVDIQEFFLVPHRRRDLLGRRCAGASRPTTRSRAS